MPDIILLAILVAFFALATVFVRACEHIIGPDLESEAAAGTTQSDRSAA